MLLPKDDDKQGQLVHQKGSSFLPLLLLLHNRTYIPRIYLMDTILLLFLHALRLTTIVDVFKIMMIIIMMPMLAMRERVVC